MKIAIIESYLMGLENPPGTVEGLTKKVNDLTAELRFPPLSGDEINRLAARFCPLPAGQETPFSDNGERQEKGNANRARRSAKKKADE